MKEIAIGDNVVRIRATPIALVFHKQEFGSDLLGNIMAMETIKKDPKSLDSVAFLQMIWAMAKADAFGKEFPSFLAWVGGLKSFDLFDLDLIKAVMEEAADGFLSQKRTRKKPQDRQPKKTSAKT